MWAAWELIEGKISLALSDGSGSGAGDEGWSVLALCLIPIPLAAALGNALVMFAVGTRSELQTSTGTLIFSMAVSDVVLGLFVMPFAIVKLARGQDWPFGLAGCDLWHSLDIFASTASIWNLGAIAIDRRLAISHPLNYQQLVSTNRVFGAISAIWLGAGLLAFVPIPYWRAMSPELYEDSRRCVPTNDAVYVLFASFVGFYVPLAVILIMYWRVFKVASRHAASLLTGSRRISMGSSLFMRVHRGSQPHAHLDKAALANTAANRRQGPTTVPLARRPDPVTKYRHRSPSSSSSDGPRGPASKVSFLTASRQSSAKSNSASELSQAVDQRQVRLAPAPSFSKSSHNIRFPSGGLWTTRPHEAELSARLLSAHQGRVGHASPVEKRVKRWAQSYLQLAGEDPDATLYRNPDASHSFLGRLPTALSARASDGTASSSDPTTSSKTDNYQALHSAASRETLGESPKRRPSSPASPSACPVLEVIPPDDEAGLEPLRQLSPNGSFEQDSRCSSRLSLASKSAVVGDEPAVPGEEGLAAEEQPSFARLLTPEARREERSESQGFLGVAPGGPLNRSPSKTSLKEKISKRLSVSSVLRRRSDGPSSGLQIPLHMPMPPHQRSHIVRGFKKIWKEKRAAKTVGVVVGCFLLCWVPFFTVNILVTVCQDCLRRPQSAFAVATWFGYFNSALNPLIYAYFNRQFKRAFLQVLFCKGRKKRYGTIRMLVKQSVPMTQLLVETKDQSEPEHDPNQTSPDTPPSPDQPCLGPTRL